MKLILIHFLVVSISMAMFCQYFPLDQKACIEKTIGIACQFSFFENACIETKDVSLGCAPNINLIACLQQSKLLDGSEVRCYFGKKCVEANQFHLKNLDCSQNFSKYACLNLYEKKCIWRQDQFCQSYSQEIPLGNSCETIFGTPVSPRLCAQIEGLACYNNGFEGGYYCNEISDDQIQNFSCDTLGLNKVGCVQLKKEGQRCVFQNGTCRNFIIEDEIRCNQAVNKEACLSITNPQVKCIWASQGCQTYTMQFNEECQNVTNVNPSVCSSLPALCSYDQNTNSCAQVEAIENLTCNTNGLSIDTCQQIKAEKCIYYQEKGCSSLKTQELNLINCDSLVNELACVNITTPSQLCQWTGIKCERILINQDVDCPLPLQKDITIKVNGNVCSAISKQDVGCKYNSVTHLCESNSTLETCTTSFLNLFACVQIQSAIACRWDIDAYNCEEARIIDQVTKCKDLLYANPIACSQISEVQNGQGVGCYYSDDTQQCTTVNSDTLKNMECTQKGLNKYGCTMISKPGQKCRWVRGSCTKIKSKEQIAQVSCLDLQFVNAGSCAMVTFNSEVCKYKTEALGCVNTINSSDSGDYCDTPGLNSIACQQITRNPSGCYFDKTNNICVVAPSSTSTDLTEIAASQQLLNTAKCVENSPTKNICVAIQTLGQYCSWNSRNSYCENQFVQLNEKCLDYNTGEKQKISTGTVINVNANVCASIVMNYPNQDPKSTLTPIDPLRGYCQYDGKGNCIKFQVKTCTDPCCGEVLGINAHVCSRYTSGQYCYFNEYNKCVLLTNNIVDTTQKQAVKDFYNYKQYKCSSMNVNSCTMIDWSPNQQCYWDGKVCTQLNYSNYPKFTIDIFFPLWLSKYACQGIEASTTNVRKYFLFNDAQLCVDQIFIQTNCEVDGINSNSCLGLTPKIYCKWDKASLTCKTIDDYLQLYTCNESQNKQACIDNPYVPCAFIDSSDKCISSPQNVRCIDFNAGQPYAGWVNSKACANITKSGQICIFNEILNLCQDATYQTSTSCDLDGINSIGCYQNTQGNCRWDQINLQCYEEGDQEAIQNLMCNDNVNKKLCLSLTNDNCEWSTIDMKCYSIEKLNSIDITSFYNPQACTSLIGAAYAYNYNNGNGKCELETTFNNDCTSKIFNKQACLLNTRSKRCFFDATQPPEKKCQTLKEEQLTCVSNILVNIEICMNIPQTCYFEEKSLTCKSISIQSSYKCSTLIVDGQYYNKLSCSSISDQITDTSTDDTLKICTQQDPATDKAQQCYFEKYCQWDQSIYGCTLSKIGTGTYHSNQNGTSCSLKASTFTCSNIYSRAACLQFGSGCYFDLNQGGCLPYTANLYKVTDCSQINGQDCNLSKTDNAYCKTTIVDDTTDYTSNCEIDAPIINTCGIDNTQSNPLCSSLSSQTTANICSSASDFCYFNSTCKIPDSITNINCSTIGVSKTLCLSLSIPCDFSSGKCQPLTIPSLSSDKSNYYYVCNEVNYLITYQGEYACGQIQSTPCQYKLNSCQNAFFQQCYDLLDLTVSLMACVQCKDLLMAYDYDKLKCIQITELTSTCDTLTQSNCKAKNCQWNSTLNKCHISLTRLNKSSCLQLTLSISATWNDTIDQCVLLQSNQISQISDCTILSRKACLQSSLSCWISSDTLQCENVNEILVDCSEINQLLGQKQQCKVSNKVPCKWSSNQCVTADLAQDSCNNMNKFGCINIQQKLNCGWSDVDKACTLIKPNFSIGCSYYMLGSNYNQVNPYVCSQLTGANNSCYFDKRTNKCTAVGTVKLYCNTHVGINKLACLRLTQNKCKFDSNNFQCIPLTEQDATCDASINQVACLSQPNVYCEYYLDKCGDFYLLDKVSVFLASLPLPVGKIISSTICKYYNQNILYAYFIYDSVRKQCLNADMPSPSQYFALCNSISISQKVCLEKTMEYCSYQNDQCQSLSLYTIRKQSDCSDIYSWKACISINANCKFQDGKCIPISTTDTCASLAILLNVYVGPQVCAQFSTPCKYSSKSFTCIVVVSLLESCNASGLSKVACLEYTTSSFCQYDVINNKCQSTYDNSLPCSDSNTPKNWYINKTKCFFISATGNYCKFQDGECQNNTKDQLTMCNSPVIQINPISCQLATDGICYYLPIPSTCVLGDQGYLNVQPWSIGKSFNKISCTKYDSLIDKVKLIWDDVNGCTELSSNDLANIQCNSPVNRLACVSITNPTQFCQYDIVLNQCDSYPYTIPPLTKDKACAQLTNVNRFEFCQYASDDCVYNSITRNCVSPDLESLKQQILAAEDCFDKGLSESLCDPTKLTLCRFSSERKLCYGGNIFCSDQTVQSCMNVSTEPCWIQNGQCKGISFTDLGGINCSDAVNQIGCTSISNPEKLCQFDRNSQTCNDLIVLNNGCSSYSYVNSGRACEQTTDVACKFDFLSKSCKEVPFNDQFECDRGLNQLACQNYTRQSLKCKYRKYCIGPTYGVESCQDAINKEVCLNFDFQCQWNTNQNKCIDFDSSSYTCQMLEESRIVISSQVCYKINIEQGACIYDAYQYTCKFITPTMCEQLETKNQCIKMEGLSCIWANEKCSQIQIKDSDTCLFIGENGSKNACLSIYRQGQKCQYINNQCNTFHEDINDNNCLDNINQIACTTQQFSLCQWQTELNQDGSIKTQSCIIYNYISSQGCNSSLSYLSCFTVTMKGQFCRWQNSACQNIIVNQEQKVYYNSYQLVNANSCGLVNVGKVKYNLQNNSCMILEQNDEVSCKCGNETDGLNQASCLSITKLPCRWVDQYKTCVEFGSKCDIF